MLVLGCSSWEVRVRPGRIVLGCFCVSANVDLELVPPCGRSGLILSAGAKKELLSLQVRRGGVLSTNRTEQVREVVYRTEVWGVRPRLKSTWFTTRLFVQARWCKRKLLYSHVWVF